MCVCVCAINVECTAYRHDTAAESQQVNMSLRVKQQNIINVCVVCVFVHEYSLRRILDSNSFVISAVVRSPFERQYKS